MKLAHYSLETGEIIGFYDSDIHAKIPVPHIQLHDDEWQAALLNRKKILNGALVDAPVQLSYADKRTAEYPSFADQFDLLFHGGVDAWKAVIQAVKDKYPKE